MRDDLAASLTELLQRHDVLSLRIRPDRLVFDEETVLEETNPNDSIPFALYRDGLRRMDFSRGVTEQELEALLSATAAGFAFSGLGDDIVSHLWSCDLEHIRYLVVDTSIVEASSGPTGTVADGAENYSDVDAQIDGLLQAIYGASTDDVGPRAVHLDAADLGAKQIAEALDDVAETFPGFHPARRLGHPPAYAGDIIAERDREDENRVAARAANATLTALDTLDGLDADAAADGLLRMFDTAVMAHDLPLATRIVSGVRMGRQRSPRVTRWLDEAVSEARVRHAIGSAIEADASKERFVRLFRFLEACGPKLIPLVVPAIGQFEEPVRRRAVTDLIVELGGTSTDLVRGLLDDSAPAVVQEGLHLLQASPSPEGAGLLRAVEQHQNPLARVALLEALGQQGGSAALNAATRLLTDTEPKVRMTAAQCLSKTRHPDAASVIARAVESPSFEQESPEVRRALLLAYAETNGTRSCHVLSRLIKRGEGVLARKDAEDLALAAVLATAAIPNQAGNKAATELLRRSASSKSRRIREAAQQALERRRGHE